MSAEREFRLDTSQPGDLDAGEIEEERWNGLVVPRSRLKMLDFATRAEQGAEDQNIGFSARLFAQVSLPQRNPGEIPYYERRNGNVTLTMSPGLITRRDRTKVRKYPYGIYPRLALTYVATEAFRTQSPVIDLGRSMRSFLSKLNVEYSGRNANIVKDQLAALFGAQLSVEGLAVTESGHGTVSEYFQIAKSVSLWWANREELGDEGLWASEVHLSEEFFNSIKASPVPVDLKAIRALGGSSLRIDLYIWATYRMYYMTKPTRIKWEDLSNQFGAQYGRLRAFKAAFIKELQAVQIVYPALNAEVTQDYLILRPSLTHVRSHKPYKAVESKARPAK
ncbi:plasmid replication protein [Leifsonia sp. LS1]|uniref:replication protein RepA n=1 Tax=Leifsonia sp. LS1 TaxID=2828483 RepID=UPI001CFEBDE6|nr:replication protein RepA [Leifsonia sp. LS1]GIT82090.1 plasmid replication protein [Leifsonia sp. LS1]